jgi:hypothetical protein
VHACLAAPNRWLEDIPAHKTVLSLGNMKCHLECTLLEARRQLLFRGYQE